MFVLGEGQELMMIFRAGVSGLSTALLLSKDNRNEVTVAAKHMPGDYDAEYASPIAGANYMPYVGLCFLLLCGSFPFGAFTISSN